MMARRLSDLGKRTLVMGILNVTPDSFSDGGKYISIDQAVIQAEKLVQDGADIIDIGGESTRPGSKAISLEEELERVIPVILAIRQELDVPISIDTYKAGVAEQAIEAGADIVNDIWRCIADPKMADVVAKHQVPIILMLFHFRTPLLSITLSNNSAVVLNVVVSIAIRCVGAISTNGIRTNNRSFMRG